MSKVTEKTIEYLAVCDDEKAVKEVLRAAEPNVLKSICNAAANAARGDVGIPYITKPYFVKHRKAFRVLISRTRTLEYKQEYVLQDKHRVIRLIPPLLNCVIASIGTSFVLDDKNDVEENIPHEGQLKLKHGRDVNLEMCEDHRKSGVFKKRI